MYSEHWARQSREDDRPIDVPFSFFPSDYNREDRNATSARAKAPVSKSGFGLRLQSQLYKPADGFTLTASWLVWLLPAALSQVAQREPAVAKPLANPLRRSV